MIKEAIQIILWSVSIMSVIIIFTVKDPRAFGVIALIGFISTWILIKLDKFEKYLDD